MPIHNFWLAASNVTNPFPGLETVFHQMNLVSQVACGLLILIALGCLGKYLARGRALKAAEMADEEFLHAYRSSAHALSVFHDQLRFPGSPSYAPYEWGCKELSFHLLGTDTVDNSYGMRMLSAGRITPSHMDVVRRAMDRRVIEAGRFLEAGLSGVGVKSLPFIGLLGTLLAWLEDAGSGIGNAAVASALLPMALSIVIYLLFMSWHNAIVRRARADFSKAEDFATELSGVFDRTYVDHRKPLESLPSLGMMDMNDAPNFSLPPSDSITSRQVRTAPSAHV